MSATVTTASAMAAAGIVSTTSAIAATATATSAASAIARVAAARSTVAARHHKLLIRIQLGPGTASHAGG